VVPGGRRTAPGLGQIPLTPEGTAWFDATHPPQAIRRPGSCLWSQLLEMSGLTNRLRRETTRAVSRRIVGKTARHSRRGSRTGPTRGKVHRIVECYRRLESVQDTLLAGAVFHETLRPILRRSAAPVRRMTGRKGPCFAVLGRSPTSAHARNSASTKPQVPAQG
jgi:hypothetical protein